MQELSFLLQQHTPIIHFQKQVGATLRATEVKPKLDRFLIKIMDGEEVATSKYQKWLLKTPGKIAFDYKINIHNPSAEITEIPEGRDHKKPFYFANMGNEYRANPKFFSYTQNAIKVSIKTQNKYTVDNENLLGFIYSILPEFFLSHNFGTRQSKGFGSFYLASQDQMFADPFEIVRIRQYDVDIGFLRYNFSIQGQNDLNGFLQTLDKVEVFYKALRSGINQCFGNNRHYLKSLIWLYFKNGVVNNLKWEKKAIKEKFLSSQLAAQTASHKGKTGYANSPLGHPGTNPLAIKDLFGLASEEKWEAMYGGFQIEKVIANVDRFKSPIFFKPIFYNNAWRIFFHAEEINASNSVLGKTIEINKTLNINTPGLFDFHDFFDFLRDRTQFNLDIHFLLMAYNQNSGNNEYMRVRDIRSQGSDEFNNCSNYIVLRNIFTQLQNRP